MEIRVKIDNSVQAFHFTDVLLQNCLSFRVLSELRKIDVGDEHSFCDKTFTIFVTVPINDEEVPF